jgi:hypothetical protein
MLRIAEALPAVTLWLCHLAPEGEGAFPFLPSPGLPWSAFRFELTRLLFDCQCTALLLVYHSQEGDRQKQEDT